MPRILTSPIGRFRLIAILEGISYVLLVGVAMPLKYLAGEPLAVRVVGAAHGGLFVLYGILLLLAGVSARWSLAKMAWYMFVSLFPIGTFLIEPSLRRQEEAAYAQAAAPPPA
jgi:integral membrane protein